MKRLRLIVVFAYAIGLGFGFIGAARSSGPLAARSDFVAFYTGATVLLQGDGARLYDERTHAAVQVPLLDSFGVRVLRGATVNMFLLPPFAALLLVPFALLPLTASFVVWVACSAAATAFATWRTLVTLGWETLHALLGVLLALTYLPTMAALLLGQNTPLLLLLFALMAEDLLNGRSRRAGLWLALTIFKPQYVFLPALSMLWSRQWRALAFLALGAGALVAVSLLVVGIDGARSFVTQLSSASASGGAQTVHPEVMHNWRGLATRLLLQHAQPLVWPVTLALDAVTICVLAWIWLSRWSEDREGRLVCLSALICAAVLVSPHTNAHDAALLVLPGCWLATLARDRRLSAPLVWAVLAFGHLAGLAAGFAGLEGFATLNAVLCAGVLLLLLGGRCTVVVRAPALG